MNENNRGPILLAGLSAMLTILGVWLIIMSYGGAYVVFLLGIISFPVAMIWLFLASRQPDADEQDTRPLLSSAEWYLLGVTEQKTEGITLEEVQTLNTPHFSSERLIEAYVLLKNKGLIAGDEEEDTLELMRILQREDLV